MSDETSGLQVALERQHASNSNDNKIASRLTFKREKMSLLKIVHVGISTFGKEKCEPPLKSVMLGHSKDVAEEVEKQQKRQCNSEISS